MLIGKPEDSFPHDEHVWLLIDRYLDGDPSAREPVRLWLAGDPSRAAIIRDLRTIREAATTIASPRRVDEAWNRFRAGIDAQQASRSGELAFTIHPELAGTLVAHVPDSRWTLRRTAVRLASRAAAVLLLTGATWWARDVMATPDGSGERPRVFTSAKGQRPSFLLTDGTRVTLAPESRLIVPARFDRTTRDVILEGRGYFEVDHRSTLPFIVHVKNVLVRDFGTRFAVHGYSADTAVRVLVTSGKATVRSDLTVAVPGDMLETGMEATLNTVGAASVRSSVDTAQALGWRAGTLEFVEARFGDVVTELSRWYDVEVVFSEPSLKSRRLSVRVPDAPLPTVLDQLARAAGAQVVRHGRVVVFSSVADGDQH
ncbi:MAG: FecR domain-containing protein [Gemmatimonadetes bacterium]|nr:FecR domain-containing protein [Gemmatimonadota bacterium]